MNCFIIYIFIFLLIIHLFCGKDKYKYIIHHTVTIIFTIIALIYNEIFNIYIGISIELNQYALGLAKKDSEKYKTFFIVTWYYRILVVIYLILYIFYSIIYININYIMFLPIILYYPYYYKKIYDKLNKTNSEIFL